MFNIKGITIADIRPNCYAPNDLNFGLITGLVVRKLFHVWSLPVLSKLLLI